MTLVISTDAAFGGTLWTRVTGRFFARRVGARSTRDRHVCAVQVHDAFALCSSLCAEVAGVDASAYPSIWSSWRWLTSCGSFAVIAGFAWVEVDRRRGGAS